MSARQPLWLIAAMANNRVIGDGPKIPWRLPEDMKRFRALTEGHAILMGRKTFDSIGKPLPKRRNIIVSRTPGLVIAGCEVVNDVVQAIALARQTDSDPCIAGGAEIYKLALPHVTRMELTLVDGEFTGDAYFPEWNASEWQETARAAGQGCTYVTLQRVNGS
jgi:dihydrofolate reductase